jgi:hypothetical protein
MRAAFFLLGLMFYPAASLADSDVLLQAVSFAITGSDASKVVAIDRQRCIFKVDDDTYYFNSIYTDRIQLKGMKNNLTIWTEVFLHGKTKVVDVFSAPLKYSGTEIEKMIKAETPRVYQPHTDSYADYDFRVFTSEIDRLKRAWEYIYANGCKGMTSPF